MMMRIRMRMTVMMRMVKMVSSCAEPTHQEATKTGRQDANVLSKCFLGQHTARILQAKWEGGEEGGTRGEAAKNERPPTCLSLIKC